MAIRSSRKKEQLPSRPLSENDLKLLSLSKQKNSASDAGCVWKKRDPDIKKLDKMLDLKYGQVEGLRNSATNGIKQCNEKVQELYDHLDFNQTNIISNGKPGTGLSSFNGRLTTSGIGSHANMISPSPAMVGGYSSSNRLGRGRSGGESSETQNYLAAIQSFRLQQSQCMKNIVDALYSLPRQLHEIAPPEPTTKEMMDEMLKYFDELLVCSTHPPYISNSFKNNLLLPVSLSSVSLRAKFHGKNQKNRGLSESDTNESALGLAPQAEILSPSSVPSNVNGDAKEVEKRILNGFSSSPRTKKPLKDEDLPQLKSIHAKEGGGENGGLHEEDILSYNPPSAINPMWWQYIVLLRSKRLLFEYFVDIFQKELNSLHERQLVSEYLLHLCSLGITNAITFESVLTKEEQKLIEIKNDEDNAFYKLVSQSGGRASQKRGNKLPSLSRR